MLRHVGIALDEVEHVGIAIRSVGVDQRHTGLLIRPDEKPLAFVHLASDYKFRREAPDFQYGWTLCAHIHPTVLGTMADWVDLVWRANGEGIPYGFDIFDPLDFADDGSYLAAPHGKGLTCATFVLVAFTKFGVQLVNVATWNVARDGDAEWQRQMLAYFDAKDPLDAAQREAQERNVGVVPRFRPEEAASAATLFNDVPVSFQEAEAAGTALVRELNRATLGPALLGELNRARLDV